MKLNDLIERVARFKDEAHDILGVHEDAAQSRLVRLDRTYRALGKLSLAQDELIRQALTCTEYGLFRPAHVMGWAGFIDFLEQKLGSDGLVKVKAARPNWTARNIEELREQVPEPQMIEVAQKIGLCNKGETKAMLGLLNKRNECAHPSDYWPDLNQTLGYLAELLSRIDALQKRSL
jgi:hypothetical protein